MSTAKLAAPATESATKSRRQMAREPKIAAADQLKAQAPAKRESKSDLVIGMLQRPEGATIGQLIAATGWLPHTIRAALTGLRKKGHAVTTEKVEDQRHYRIVCGAG